METQNNLQKNSIFWQPLLKRMFLRFVVLGLLPTMLLLAVPTAFIVIDKAEPLSEPLIVIWVTQGAAFLVILLFGARESLRQLAFPIQELITGANAIASGDFSYRVPVLKGGQDMLLLSQTFNTMAEAVAVMHDSMETQRILAQNNLDTREQEFAAMLEISNLVNNNADLATTAERALRIAHNVLGSDMIALVLLEQNVQITSMVFSCKDCPHEHPRMCKPCERRPILWHTISRAYDDLVQTVIDARTTVFVADSHATDVPLIPPVVRAFDRLEVQRLCFVPLVASDNVPGVLVLMRHTTGQISQHSRRLSMALSENIAVLLENWRLKNQVRTLTIMRERRRLARELHDSVTQSLFTLSLTARGLKAQLDGIPQVNHQALDILIEQTRVIQVEMRALINELRPVDLETDRLEDALRRHVQSLHNSSGTDVRLETQGEINVLSPVIQQNLNRVAQEGLSNIGRHAKAAKALLSLSVTDEYAIMTIWDNGIGFDAREAVFQPSSLGLTNMRERVEMLGGALMVRSNPGQETILTVRIPIHTKMEATNA